jgi:hypothetical protein
MPGSDDNDNIPDNDRQAKREGSKPTPPPSIGENEEFAEIEVFEYEYADIEVKNSRPPKK